jgi:hypothetical protein
VLAGRAEPERMDVCPGSKTEGSESDSQCYVQSSRGSRIPESKAFVSDMSSVRHGADDPGRQAPRLCMSFRQGKHHADERIHDSEGYHRTNPRVPT